MGSTVKNILIIAIIGLFCFVVWYIAAPTIKTINNHNLSQRIGIEIGSNDNTPIGVSFGTTTLNVELAASQTDQEQGLGGRTSLDDNAGMLFVFDKPTSPSMWMKDMLFPLDIAWLDQNFKIVHIEKNLSPDTFPQSFKSNTASQYVLEVNAGFFDDHGIKEGDILQLQDNNK
jgi:uncharacterized membrane protein (UPF0127 family)